MSASIVQSKTIMNASISRRRFLGQSTAALAASALAPLGCTTNPPTKHAPDFRPVDFHVHLDNSTIDQVLQLPQARHIKLGIVEHAGTKENKYPTILSNDEELRAYLKMLTGKPVYRGVQAEWIDWMSCFSPETLAQLDYVLSDAMTMPGPDGQRMKSWEKNAEIGDPQSFMDQYVDWHVQIMAETPLDILANTTWLPATIAADYDKLWTDARMRKVIDAAVKNGVALEISSRYEIPKLPFLIMARAAGAKFSFGSNGRYPNMGKLDYCVQIAKELGLTRREMFTPARDGQKAVQRRKNFKR